MPEENASPSILRSQIDATIRAVAPLHAKHHEKATSPQRAAGRLTAILGGAVVPRRTVRHGGRLDRWKSAGSRASLSPGRSASLCVARRGGTRWLGMFANKDHDLIAE
jgi:hypothetical protein